MQKPDLIEFETGKRAKAREVNQNFEAMSDYVFGSSDELKSYVQTAVANVNSYVNNSLPTGMILAFSGEMAPNGWLLCDGAEVSRTDYSKLFEVIGTKYGEGNGSTTFNVPNLVNKFVEGSTTAGTEKEAGLPNITATLTSYRGSGAIVLGSNNITPDGTTGPWVKNATFNASRCSSIYKDDCDTVQPPALTMLYIIRT